MNFIKVIKHFFLSLFNSFKYKRITNKLEKGAKQQKDQRLQLAFLIAKFKQKCIRRIRGKNSSKYIPLSFKEKQEIKYQIEAEFGTQLTQLNLKINNKLQPV